MVNEEKVKVMNRLAMYEHGEGRKYLPVSRYYRSDYIGLALIKNFFLVTIGYVLLLAGIAAYFSESGHADRVFCADLYSVFCEISPRQEECEGILSGSYQTGKNLRTGRKENTGPEKIGRT